MSHKLCLVEFVDREDDRKDGKVGPGLRLPGPEIVFDLSPLQETDPGIVNAPITAILHQNVVWRDPCWGDRDIEIRKRFRGCTAGLPERVDLRIPTTCLGTRVLAKPFPRRIRREQRIGVQNAVLQGIEVLSADGCEDTL